MSFKRLRGKTWRGIAIVALLVATAHRSPAPIIEDDDVESPTPAPELAGLPASTPPPAAAKPASPALEVPPPTNTKLSDSNLPGMPIDTMTVMGGSAPPLPSASPQSGSPSALPPGTISYSPIPGYPQAARMTEPMQRGSGTFRIIFDDAGNATSVDTVQSTGFGLLDRSATTTFKKWKTIPGKALTVLVPITFDPEASRPVPKPSEPKHSP